MARTAHIPLVQPQAGFPSLRRAIGGTASGALLYLLSFVGTVTLRLLSPLAQALYSGFIAAQQRRADQRVWEMAQSDPRLKAELVALRQRAASGG
jgi:hypothetical protein